MVLADDDDAACGLKKKRGRERELPPKSWNGCCCTSYCLYHFGVGVGNGIFFPLTEGGEE